MHDLDFPLTFLTERELATRWGISVKTIRNKRVEGGGPSFLKLGRSVRYRIVDIEAFEHSRLFASTTELSNELVKGRPQ